MLRVYGTVLEMLRGLRPVIARVERRDADLARQLRRAIGRTQSTKPLFDS